ncbi:hypothetical protein DDZ13_13120 [Coraliomargarita sinensis]|uniref:Uncharacterized protein n=1 Tax=Coraliomargarita sinensis TaxID=2174842 RepID=A0A317ZDL0_9BACT|nr:hypothetical protein [Coraliomargarita sinensis]PXA03160.1 hypothetical protein DDZ13_13120 [Coraliomargarita sinensis]
MKYNECNHEVSFATSLLVTNPYNYPCPHCQKNLTLDKTGRRFLLGIATSAFLYAGAIGTVSILAAFQGIAIAQLALLNIAGLASGALFVLPLIYIAWKHSRFIERRKLENVRQFTRARADSEKTPFRYRLILSPSKC